MFRFTTKSSTLSASNDFLDDKNVRFAMSRALNERMKEVQKSNRDRLDNVFEGGATGWTKKATVIDRWAKRDDLIVRLHHKDAQRSYLMLQEHGGTATPPANGRAIRVPMSMRTNRFGALPRGAVKKLKNDAQVLSGKPDWGSRDAPAGIWRRVGRSKIRAGGGRRRRRVLKSGDRLTLLVLYADSVKIKPRYGFYKFVQTESRKGLKAHFRKELRAALSSKPRSRRR